MAGLTKKTQMLYDTMKQNGADVGTPQEFQQWFFAKGEQGYKNRKQVWQLFHDNGADVGKNYEEMRDWLGLHQTSPKKAPKQSAQTQQAKDVGTGIFGSQGNVPSSIARQDNYTRPGSLVEQLNQRDKEAEEAITKPLRETAKKVQNRQFTPQKVQYVDENDNVVDEDEVYPIMPKETAEDELNRMAYDRLQAVNNTDIDAQIAALDKETRDIFQNSVDNYKRGKKPKSIWERMADVGTTNAMPSGTREYMEMVDAVGGNPEYKNRVAALNLLKQASYVKRAAEQSKKTNVENKKGIGDWVDDTVGWFEDAGFGMKEAAKNVSTWDMGATAATDAKALYDAAQKFDNGEKLSESEQQLLNAAATYSAFENAYGKDVGSGVKAGQITMEALPFMAEMLVNPASGAGKALQKKFVSKGMTELVKGMVKSIAKKQGRKAAAKELAKGTLARVGGDLLGAAVMAGTTGAEGVAGDTFRRMQGQSQYGVDVNGDIQYSGRGEDRETNPLVAAAKAFGARTFENQSEMVGAYFGPALGVAGKFVEKGLSKMKLGGVVDFIKSIGATKGAKLVDNFFEKTKWDGTIGEYAEEVVGGIENALVVGDQTLDRDPETGVFNGEQNLETFLSVALMGGFMSTLHTGVGAWSYARGKQQLNRADYLASESLGDKWGDIKRVIDGSTDGDASRNLNQILADGSLSDEQKAAVREYAKRKETLRGVLYGEEARKKEKAQEKAATRASNIDVGDDGQTVVQTNQNGEVISEEKFDDEEEAKAHADMLKLQRAEQDFQDDLALANDFAEQRRQAVENGTPDDFPLSEDMERYVRTQALNRIIPDSVEVGSPEYEAFVRNMYTPGTAENDILVEMMDSYDPLNDAYESVSIDNDSDRNEIDKAIKTDPVKRTERQQKLVSEFAEHLHMFNFPKGELHPEQSFTDGQTQADLDGAGTEYAMPENMVHAREEMEEAQTALDDAMAQNSELAGYVNETINSNEPVAPEDVVAGMIGRFSDEERRTVCDYINAQSRLQGYLDFTDKKMRQFVARETSKRAFKGTLNGEQQGNMVMVSDGEKTYFLVGGDVNTDENGKPIPDPSQREGGAAQTIVVVDEEGNIMPMGLDSSLTVMPGQTYDEYSASLLEQMQVKTTAEMGYKASPNPSLEGDSAMVSQGTEEAQGGNLDNASGEAGADGTGGNGPLAAAAPASAEPQQPIQQEPPTPTAQEIPTDKDGVKMYEQGVNVDDAIADIRNDGMDPSEFADLAINEAQTELSKMKEPKTRADLVRNNARRKELQNTIDYYTSMKERVTPTPTRPEGQETAAATEGEPSDTVAPEWRYDKPEDARRRGYKVVEGHRIDRQEEKPMPQGMEVEVQYSTKDKVKGRLTVSELDDVQGSHLTNGQRNEKHFLPEAQPKAEFGADRQTAAKTNASEENFRPELMLTFNGTQSAYSGSTSQTNRRGEIIQGNGRRNLAEYIYAPGNEAVARKYKDFLKAHAEELGTTAEAIEQMEKPFAHIVLDVTDAEAIRLGQFTAQDLESGGKKVPEVSNVTTKLGGRYSNLANIILNHEDPDASLSERIEANAEAAVKWLNNTGVINNTETKTLLEDKALARQFLKDVITDQLFKDAHPDLRTMFYELPKNIQSAIISVVGREVAMSEDKSILKDIQESIRAYHELMTSSPEFAGAQGANFEKRYAAVAAAVNDWLRQINMDGTVNSEKFSNFALELAKLYKSLKDQKTLAGMFREYYDIAGGSTRELGMFDDNSQAPKTKEELIKQIFGVDYGRQRTVPVAGNNQEGQAGEQDGTDNPQSGEREQEETGPADNRGGDTGNGEEVAPSGEPEGTVAQEADAEPQPAGKKKTKTAAPSMEEIREAAGVEETAEEPKKEGENPSGNKLVTDERYAELKKRMRDKLLGQMNVGVDPEILAIGVEMAVYHIEKGARKFADYARGMIEDLGDVIRPYLKAFYNGARDLPEMEELSKEMDDYGTVQSFDIANFDKTAADPMEQAKEIRDEAKVDKDVQKAKENIKIVAKENKKKRNNVSSQQKSTESTEKTEGTEQQLDLFNLNTEENEQKVRRDERLPEEQGSGSESEGQDSGDTERVREGGSLEQDRSLQSGLSGAVEGAEAEPQPAEKKNQRNNRNERGKDYAPTSATARVKANVAAIRLLKQLEAEDRDATPEEMAVLKQYSGWGGLGGAFNERSPYYNEVRDLLDDAEYDSAAMSINSAYYTPASVIDRLWDVASRLGFKGGKVLESSAGIGNIIASMPESMNERSDIEMVEIDSISGRILSKLYPDAKVNIKGFEDTRIENGSVDLAITNVPFVTGLKVRDEVDTDLSRQFGNIHDFVIAKNIRKLKEGGIGIFITTSNTLDKSDALREWIDGKGDTDVMGVFRLNNETFGGTNVTSDIIVVRKRVNGERHPDAIDVKQSSVIRDGEYENQDGKYDWKTGRYETKRTSMRVNSYLNEHPENMGGEMAFGFEKGDTFRPGSYGLYPSEKNQEQLLDAWVQKMKDVFAAVIRQRTQQEDTDVREGRMFVKDGKIFVSQQGKAVPYATKKAKVKGKSVEECVKDYVAIRESLADVLKYQLENESDTDLKPLLDKLNKAYDNFVKKYGYLHKNTAISFLRDDIEFPDIAALENYSESKDIEGNKIVRVGKSKVFEGRVLRFKTEPKPQNVKDGVLASVQQFGKIDLGWIAQNVPDQTESSVRAEVLNSGYGFEDPVTKKIEARYEYLSGNVREKLRQARENNTDGRYDKNIEALEKVIPMDIPAHLIDFSLGSSWIDPKLYEDFVKDKYGCTVRLVNVGGTWSMEVLRGEYDEKNRAGGVHSELLGDTIPASKLVEAAINNRTYKVQRTFKDWDGSKHTETDKAATQACQNRIGEIKDEFNEWAKGRMQTDVEMAEKMMRVYNDKFNSMVPKEVDDTFVPEQFEGAVDYIHLYPHQSKAVMRAVTEPVMLAHQVGAGKTFTLITTAMEMRRLGTAKKPMIVVQNATVGQFVASAKMLYPNAKILSLTERDRDAEGRRAFYGKIKYNDWDMIVIPQSTFERIPDSPERQQEFIQEKIDDKLHALEAARQAKADDRLVKQMEREIDDLEQERDDIALGREPKKGKKKDEEKTKKNTAARAKEQLDRHADDVMYFDDMGIDALLIDEAHEYKRLGFSTTMGRGVKGIDPAGSKKAAGVYLKTRGILKSNGWKNVVFATGTPISNTAAEIWTFMKYLMPKEVMMEQEIWYFDDFVHNFGKVAQSLEFATNGKFKENTRFAAYINKPELIRIWSTVADTVLAKDMPSVAEKLPEKENGKDQDVFLPQTQSLIGIMRAVRRKLEEFEKMSGAEKRANSSVPLVMYGLAKRAAIDPRLVDAGAMDEPNSKTNKATDEIVKDLAATDSYKGTVAVFCDMQNGPEGFNIFQEMKRKLMEKGVPESKIAIITSGMTITQKEKIFEQVNSGDIRVIMGSTQTLGTGVNIQERLHLLIHMDAPDRPMDYTQRNGRILRQGNLHKEWGLPIRILRFGVEDSLDVTSYQRLKTKSGFIDSIMDGKGALANNQVDRTLEEEEEGLFGNPVAVLSGSQYALKKTQAERELRKWQSKKQQWEADQIYIENTLRRNNGQNKEAEERIKEYDNQIELAKKHFPDGKAKTITVKGVETKTEEELQKALSEQVGKPIRERVEKYRNDRTFTGATVKIPMKFDDVNVVVEVDIERETEYVQGKGLKTTMHTIYRYNIPELGIDEYSIPRGFIKDIVNDIKEDISAQTTIDRREFAQKGIEKRTADNEQLEARRSPTFKDEDKLESARKKVDEYTEEMRKEMAEKEAKYAAMDAEDVDLDAIEDNAEEEEDDSGTRLREIANNSQSSLRNNLESEVSESESVPLSERPLRTYTDYNGNVHEGLEEELQSLLSQERGGNRGETEGTGEASEAAAARSSAGVAERYARVTALRDEISRREKAREELRRKYNIDEKGNISLEDVARMFRDMNTNKTLGELFDKVYAVLKTISPNFRFTDNFKKAESGAAFMESTFYDWDTFTRRENDYLAHVLLHEMIHNVTSHILLRYEKPSYGSLTREQKRIAKEITELYEYVKKEDPRWQNGTKPYGLDNAQEMVAELANPDFRKLLDSIPYKGTTVLQRLKALIREIFGLKNDTALDRLSRAADRLIDSFDENMAYEYRRIRRETESSIRAINPNIDYVDFLEKYGLDWGDAKLVEDANARRKTDGNGGTRLREGSAATESQPAEKMKEHLTKLSKKIGVKVVFHDDTSTIANTKVKEALQKGRFVAGWYDPKDNSVHFYMPNIKDRYEAEKTIWHEVVGHKGMRALLGEEGYRTFMRRLWMDKSPAFEEMHQWVTENFMRYGGDLYETMDEWFAYNVVEPSVPKTLWDKVMQVMGDVLRKLGFMTTPNMKDMKYMLWLSKNAIKEGDAWSELQRNALLAKLDLETRRRAASYSKDAARARDGFTNTPTGETERQMYKNGLMRKMFAWTEAHQDYMASAKLLMDAILKGRSVLDKFNFYWKENHSDSKIKIAEDLYVRDYCKPMEAAIGRCLAAIGGKLSEAYETLEDYMAMKHGLERNREFFVRDWLEAKRRKTPRLKDLDEEAKREYERAARGIIQGFEDGQIETEEERDSELRKALEDCYSAMLDRIEEGWVATKSQHTENLADYLRGLDDYIREHIDGEYNPNEHDYSGLTSFNLNDNANDNEDYDDDAVIGYVMDMEGKIGEENVEELWKQKGRMTQFALDIEHEAGLITDKNYEKVSQMFHWYMPLRKWDEDMAEDIWSYMNSRKNTYVGNTLMKAKGRKSRAEMPIGTMFAMGGNAIVRAARNEVKQSFAGFVRKYEKPGDDALVTELEAWVENLGTEENPDWVYSFPDIPEGATRDEIIQAKAAWAQHMLDLMQEGRAMRVKQGDSIPYRFENKKRSRPEHIVEVYEDGRPHFFIVNDNPRAAQAINGQLKPETKHKLTAKINRFMSSVFTSYSPTFMARNAFRDAEFASSMLSVKEGWDYCKRFMENYMKVTHFVGKRPLMFTLFRKFRDGTLDESNKMERYFKEFAEQGGITGYVMENNAERWEQEILAGVKEIGQRKVVGLTKGLVKRFMDGVEHAGEAIENAARFATYVTSREDGRTITRSVTDAKEVSVNFNRKGAGHKTETLLNEKGEKTANTVWAAKTGQYMRANTLFYNASLQGIVNSVGNAMRKPWWFAAKFAIPPMVLGALIPVFNAWVHAMLDDDDDKVSNDPYADLPEYTRRMNMCLYIGHGKFVMIPLSIEHRAFFGLGDIMAGQTYNEKLKSVDHPFAVDAIRQLTAFSPVDYNSKETGIEGVTGWGIGMLVPAYVSPLVNAYFNKSWTGSQIQRENNYGGSNLPEYQKAKDYTNRRLVDASRLWHELWGGDEAVRAGRNDGNKYKEWIGEVSPAKMEYVIEQYFGEPGKIGSGVSDLFSMMFGDKEADLRKIPVVKAFMTLPNDNTQFRRVNTKYWKYRDEFKKTEQDDRQYRARIETNPDLKLEYETKFKKTRRYKQWKLYNPGKGGDGFKYKKTIEDLQKRINAEDDPVQKKGLTRERNAYVQELVELLEGVE